MALGGMMTPTATPAAPMQPTTQERRQALTPPATPEEHELLRGEWMNFFAKPEVQAGLMQFGVGMMQPLGWGQTFGGNLGMSLADAGGAVGRVNEQRLADRNFAQGQANTETEQELENRRVATVEQESARRTTDAAADRALEQRRLEEYLIPSLRQGQGGGTSDTTRNSMLKSLVTGAIKAQADAAALGDEFDLDAYMATGLMAIDKALGAAGAPAAGAPADAGGASADPAAFGLPATPDEFSDADIIAFMSDEATTDAAKALMSKVYGAAWDARLAKALSTDRANKTEMGRDASRTSREGRTGATETEIEQKRQKPLEGVLFPQ